MHPFSILTFGIFVAGYITARWDLVTRLYELAIFAWNYGVVTRAASGFFVLTAAFLIVFVPFASLAAQEARIVSISWFPACRPPSALQTHSD
jgi:phosphatidylinositol glycan class Q protein